MTQVSDYDWNRLRKGIRLLFHLEEGEILQNNETLCTSTPGAAIREEKQK